MMMMTIDITAHWHYSVVIVIGVCQWYYWHWKPTMTTISDDIIDQWLDLMMTLLCVWWYSENCYWATDDYYYSDDDGNSP